MNDLWVQRWRRTKANGDVIVVRYADDQIVGFEHEHEAKAFLHDLHERMRAFELALHPDKTRLIRFGRRAAKQREMRGEGKPETFDFLGFTHFCTRSRKWGSFVIGRKTMGEPEGGARCVSSARRDLGGGRGVILDPTATLAIAMQQMPERPVRDHLISWSRHRG